MILRNVGGLLADGIPSNLTDGCSAAKGGGRETVWEGWREETRAKPGNRLVLYKVILLYFILV